MITAIIVDDEPTGIDNLKVLLSRYCPQVKLLGVAEDVLSAQKLIKVFRPELLFLDIDMPNYSGFDLLLQYESVPFEVIFVTAYSEYALKAIRFSACDYILKPVDIEELTAAVNKASERISGETERAHLKALLSNFRSVESDWKISLPVLNGLRLMNVDDIVWCEAEGGYTWFYFTNSKKILVTKNLGEYENLLADKGFLRVHHANLINTRHIAEFRKGNSPVVVMTDGTPINVSLRKRDQLQDYFNSILR